MLLMSSACDAADQAAEKNQRAVPVKPAVVAKTAIAKGRIVHDSEYYILEAQHKEKWLADNKVIDEKLSEFRKKNDGKSPNIFYILIDDIEIPSSAARAR